MHLMTGQICEAKLSKLKGKIDSSTITVGDFNLSLSVIEQPDRG